MQRQSPQPVAANRQPLRHWLMKSEPDAFSISDLRRKITEHWDGVRNYQARNHMRSMQVGDRVLFYHSNAKPSGVAGLAEVSALAVPDHTAWDPSNIHYDAASTPDNPRWWMVQVRFVAEFPRVYSLEDLRAVPALAGMELFRRSRLSVQAVTPAEYQVIAALTARKK
jgi:predicted RNA-binding protein with PUA-like domain